MSQDRDRIYDAKRANYAAADAADSSFFSSVTGVPLRLPPGLPLPLPAAFCHAGIPRPFGTPSKALAAAVVDDTFPAAGACPAIPNPLVPLAPLAPPDPPDPLAPLAPLAPPAPPAAPEAEDSEPVDEAIEDEPS